MWGNPKLFHRAKSIKNCVDKRQILTQSIERNIEKR